MSTLYLVATPIGNLGDISQRALDTLNNVDVIASEDTRHTGLLLKHFNIKKQQMSFHEHNEERAGQAIIRLIGEGKSVALVSDAGTPGISDPGFSLVRRAIAADITVTMIPGPSALVIALVLSGLPSHSFTYCGFAPRRASARRKFLAAESTSRHTLVFYESPYRIEAFLADALEVLGDRTAALGIELTKMFETMLRGPLSELLAQVRAQKPRGEYTVVISGAPDT
jgi:16S rRNA (cytidine1402-2'-O)-methyltransferase